MSILLSLIGGTEALPLTRVTLDDFKGFETSDLKDRFKTLFEDLKGKLPYQGTIRSRTGQVVTIDAGSRQGVRQDSEIFVVLISTVQRHPKFHFITSATREIMGRVRINKADESISFGQVIEEKTQNLIQPGFKVTVDPNPTYSEAGFDREGHFVGAMANQPDHALAFGENPHEWSATPRASFGRLNLLAGFSSANLSTSLTTDSASSSNPLSPSVLLEGEMWIDPQLQLNLNIFDIISKVPNGLSGSVPDPLNFQFQQLDLTLGYNFLADESDFFGAKFHVQFGFSQASVFVQDSVPSAHTSKTYSGLAMGLGGGFPIRISPRKILVLGAQFNYHLSPGMSESSGTYGPSSNQMSQFNFSGEYYWTEKILLRGILNFEQLSSSFSGGPASSASANFTSLLFGVGFLF
ncbi:MAG: hypothetical protein C5B49_10095 [Bdellovibrio sp.]|nr:MAG: hypothetical protein C5B49_10095 [Bdellovibrio sp.]